MADEVETPVSAPPASAPEGAPEEKPSWRRRLRRLLIGSPKSLQDESVYTHLSLIAFLAWVGLGADGLSSSAYGPEELFRALGTHTYLAVGLAALTAVTVFVIAAAYARIIEKFPHGGGGYVVATKLLGDRVGVVSGCALLVDYVLTVTISVAAAGKALRDVITLFAPFPDSWVVPLDVVLIVVLTLLNLRGVKESVLFLAPIFLLFIVTHVVLIVGGIVLHLGDADERARELAASFRGDWQDPGFGPLAMLLLFMKAFSLGGGTYTGIEAVSNSMLILREPRVRTAKQTMLYMSISLAFVASGLILCYLLWNVRPSGGEHGETMNSQFTRAFAEKLPSGTRSIFTFLTVVTEAALLMVAAQAGFIAGPRTLANMAVDSWAPRRFSALSERLTTQNGVVLIAGASLVALIYTGGNVSKIVVMYSINVFLTFSLSMIAMVRFWWRAPKGRANRRSRLTLFISGSLLCSLILAVTVFEKFGEGGWITLAVTGGLVVVCFLIRKHYRDVANKLSSLYADLANLPLPEAGALPDPDPRQPTAAVLVSSYGGLGIHTVYNVFRAFPSHFKSLVFMSIGVIDSGGFKGDQAVEGLEERTQKMLEKYVELGRRLGIPSTMRMAVGTDAVQTGEELCQTVAKEFPRSTFFAGKVIFKEEGVLQRFLHNETAVALQKRLHFDGLTMVILPARVY